MTDYDKDDKKIDVITSTVKQLILDNIDLDHKIVKLVDKNFWDLI